MPAIARHAIRALSVVLGVVGLTFVLLHAAPGDPARLLAGPAATEARVGEVRSTLGLDRPVGVQFAAWITRAASGDFGTSIADGRPVLEIVATAWPATAVLVVVSLSLSWLLGIAVGTWQATTRSRLGDRVAATVTIALHAMPGYWLGLVLVLVFTYRLGILPAFGAAGVDADFLTPAGRLADHLRHAALPVLTLTLIGLGGIARFVRGSMRDIATAPFLTVARARGVSGRRVVVRHHLRNAVLPLVTLLGLSLPAIFSGAVFVEAIFAWPGVGQVLVQAVQARDYPVVMAAATITAVLVVTGNVIAELMLRWADPRVADDR